MVLLTASGSHVGILIQSIIILRYKYVKPRCVASCMLDRLLSVNIGLMVCSLPAAGLLAARVVLGGRAADGRGPRHHHHQRHAPGEPRGAERVSGLGQVLGRLLHRGEEHKRLVVTQHNKHVTDTTTTIGHS